MNIRSFLWLQLFVAPLVLAAADPIITRVPDGGIQPQAVTASNGTLHLVYFSGEARAGDLFHVQRSPGGAFTKPVRVNQHSGSAIALGTIRGAQIALGKNDRLHVVWNGSGKASTHRGAPLFYTRLDAGAFEPERDIMLDTSDLDGGATVAADPQGRVYVVWHARREPSPDGEAFRSVFLATSTNEGATFGSERKISNDGACACCAMKAFADPNGTLHLLYRAARQTTNRDAVLLASKDQGNTFTQLHAHPWLSTTCPMSSAWLGAANRQIIGAWETQGRIWFSAWDPATLKIDPPLSPSQTPGQKHPTAVQNAKGETLIVWTEGTGWQKGGALAWAIFDPHTTSPKQKGRSDGLQMWSFAAASVRPDGSFEIFY